MRLLSRTSEPSRLGAIRARFANRLRYAGRRIAKASRWILAGLVLLYRVLGGGRGLFIYGGLALLFVGLREVYPPAGYIAVGSVLLWIELRRPHRPIKLDQVLEEILSALQRRQA